MSDKIETVAGSWNEGYFAYTYPSQKVLQDSTGFIVTRQLELPFESGDVRADITPLVINTGGTIFCFYTHSDARRVYVPDNIGVSVHREGMRGGCLDVKILNAVLSEQFIGVEYRVNRISFGNVFYLYCLRQYPSSSIEAFCSSFYEVSGVPLNVLPEN